MSNDAVQPVDEISPASKEMDDWVLEIGALLDNQDISLPTEPLLQLTGDNIPEKWPSIFGNWKCWDDFGFSFLPETIKWKFVAYMRRCCGLNVRSYLEEFQEKKDDVWSYYKVVDERFRAENGKRFIEHLLANSCFLIFVIIVFTSNENNLINILGGISNIRNDEQRLIEFQMLIQFVSDRDPMSTIQFMLTMDYQIPLFVVEAVYTKHSNSSNLLGIPIHKLALSCLEDIYPRMHKSKVNDIDTITLPPGGFKHLLHIFHWSRSPQGKFQLNLDSIMKQLLTNAPIKKMDGFYIPSATDLQLSETVFKKHPDGSIDVSYSDRTLSGVMQLAPFHRFKYSTKLYESLLKFERNYPFCGLPFTAYVVCMVCLLQTEADVRLLRAKGIVPSTRNDEKEVLHYVKEFQTLLDDSDIMPDDLYDLSKKVMAHRERKSTRCYGEFKSRYCSNPWITISVIAGILLFVLTVIQTIYSALSYKKQ